MTKLQQLESIIRELVPSLQELSFGCEVECIYGEGVEMIIFECGKCPKHKTAAGCENSIYNDCYPDDAYYVRCGYEEDGYRTYVVLAKDIQNKEKYTIIGHPIQLHHVLQAIRKFKFEGGTAMCPYFIRQDGTFFKWNDFAKGGNGFHTVNSTYATWDLTKPLDGQSEEVIEFLLSILTK